MSVPSANALPIASAGQTVASTREVPVYTQNQVNRSGQTPVGTVQVTGITDAELAARDAKTATTTQATPAANINSAAPSAPQTVGVGARGDDAAQNNTTTTQTIINKTFQEQIRPEPNVLDQYYSYTYSISWYLLGPTEANQIIQTGSKSTAGWRLLMQSAGVPTDQRFSNDPADQIFSVDYYIDNLEIESLLTGAGTSFCHNAIKITFRVTEPNGITLIENLYRAVDKLYKEIGGTTNPQYLQAQYALAIRFYGYDENGRQVVPVRGGLTNQPSATDAKAVVEKLYPFQIQNITFRQAKRAVEYEIQANPLGILIGFGQGKGSVPFGFNLSGETIGQLLQGTGNPNAVVDLATRGRESTNKNQLTTANQPTNTSGYVAPNVEE
jgi:hypothetical protein